MKTTLLFLLATFSLSLAAQTTFKKGEPVTVSFYSITSEATILQSAGGKYKVHYEDKESPDEWVSADKVTKLDAGNTAGDPVPGKYVCYMPMYGHSYMGTFTIPEKGKYHYQTGRKGKGTYKYEPATRKVTWLSSDLAGKGVTGYYYNTTQNGPMITLVFPKGKHMGDIQNCLCKEKNLMPFNNNPTSIPLTSINHYA